MMWHVVLRFAPYLSGKFTDVFAEYRKSSSGTSGEDPRWQDCLSSVEGAFGMPFGLLFVEKAFEGESKKSVRNFTVHAILGPPQTRQFVIDNLLAVDNKKSYRCQNTACVNQVIDYK